MDINVVIGDSISEFFHHYIFSNEVVVFSNQSTIQGLLKELGIYKSTSSAIRSGRSGPIPDGFTFNYKASKKDRVHIFKEIK